MRQNATFRRRFLASLLAMLMLFGVFSTALAAPTPTSDPVNFTIINPYDGVDWDSYGQYRAAMHIHTARSDGAATHGETILDLYNKGFDIVGVTDHDTLDTGNWAVGAGAVTASQRDAIIAGTFGRTAYVDFDFPGDFNDGQFFRPQENGMIPIPFTNEQSRSEHIISMWANFTSPAGWTQERILEETTATGGLAILAHPGRYSTGAAVAMGA